MDCHEKRSFSRNDKMKTPSHCEEQLQKLATKQSTQKKKESIKAVSFHRLSRAELNSDLIQSQEKLCFFLGVQGLIKIKNE